MKKADFESLGVFKHVALMEQALKISKLPPAIEGIFSDIERMRLSLEAPKLPSAMMETLAVMERVRLSLEAPKLPPAIEQMVAELTGVEKTLKSPVFDLAIKNAMSNMEEFRKINDLFSSDIERIKLGLEVPKFPPAIEQMVAELTGVEKTVKSPVFDLAIKNMMSNMEEFRKINDLFSSERLFPSDTARIFLDSDNYENEFNWVSELIDVPDFNALIDDLDNEEASSSIKEIASSSGYSVLSEKSKKLVLHLYNEWIKKIILGVIIGIISGSFLYAFEYEIKDYAASFKKSFSPREATSAIRKLKGFNRDHLRGHRVVIGDQLNLRAEPKRNSQSIAMLSIGTFLEVIDKTDRAWLLVEVEVDGELERGWVMRRYTRGFN